MHRTLVIPRGMWNRLHEKLFPSDGTEGFIAGLARPCRSLTGIRYVMERCLDTQTQDVAYRHEAGIQLSRDESSRINLISARAAEFGLVPVHLHSHPAGVPDFSWQDNLEESGLHAWLRQKGQPLLISLVCARDGGPHARIWRDHGRENCRVRIGLQTMFMPEEKASNLPALDRQRAFGAYFADAAADLSVGIVGLGGVGMPVAEMLARSGFRRFVLMDPDRVELVNLNRLSGLRRRDIGRFKTDIAASAIQRACRSVGTEASIHICRADVNTASKHQKKLLGRCDLILALTDDELSRICCLTLSLEHGAEYLQAGVRIGQHSGTGVIDSIRTEVTGGNRPLLPHLHGQTGSRTGFRRRKTLCRRRSVCRRKGRRLHSGRTRAGRHVPQRHRRRHSRSGNTEKSRRTGRRGPDPAGLADRRIPPHPGHRKQPDRRRVHHLRPEVTPLSG